MSRIRTVLPSIILVAAAFLGAAPASADFSGRFSMEGGYLQHPLGIAVEPYSPYARSELALQLMLGKATRWRLTYEGSATLFDPDVPLDDMRHLVGIEWIRPRSREAWTFSAGVQGGLRRQTEYYRVYDHDEAYGYLAFKHYPHPRLMLRGWAGLRLRSYRDLPEESYLEPHLVFEAKRFGGSRTTVGATVRLGGKWFHDPVAPNVWDTEGTPVTSQLTLGANVAQGLSDRVGARASLHLRMGLQDFPYYVAENLYDSPLLDRYARSGPSALAAIKWLTPLQAWFEVGGAWTDDDYGSILFADGFGGGSTRRDTIFDMFASLERRLLSHGKGTILRATVTWRDQASNMRSYTWSGPTASAGVEWRF